MASLLDRLREAGAHEQAAALAGRAAAHAPLDNPAAVARLLDSLREAGAHEQAAALAGPCPAAHAPLDDPGAVARLLDVLREAGAHEQAAALRLTGPPPTPPSTTRTPWPACWTSLRKAGAHEQAAALAGRAAAHAPLDNPDDVARLLDSLRGRARTSRPPRCWPVTPPPTPPSTTRTPWPACWTACGRRARTSRPPRWPPGPPPRPPRQPGYVARLLHSLDAAGATSRPPRWPTGPVPAIAADLVAVTTVPAAADGEPGAVATLAGFPQRGLVIWSASARRALQSTSRSACLPALTWPRVRRARNSSSSTCPQKARTLFSSCTPLGYTCSAMTSRPCMFRQTRIPGLCGSSCAPTHLVRRRCPSRPGSAARTSVSCVSKSRRSVTAHPAPHREVLAEITTQPTAGAVSLVVRYDPSQQAYRFEFRDEDNPDEVHSNLAYDPGPVVEQLIADLDSLAAGRSGYSADQTRDYLVNAGARLWQQLVPGQLREQFWDRQHRIRQLTILADKDAVPWELLYPMDPGHDAGFLVEQFPVTRAIFGWRPGRTLRLQPARFVLPEGSLHEAAVEVEAMRRLLDPGQAPSAVISELTPLTDLIGSGKFGLLHFACHNTYEPVGGSSIRLGRVRFTPTLLEVAAIQKALQASAPTVFINACRSAGLAATYNRLDGWASKFLEAGAAAFIGSLWAVSDGASREFARGTLPSPAARIHPRGRRDGGPPGGGQPA